MDCGSEHVGQKMESVWIVRVGCVLEHVQCISSSIKLAGAHCCVAMVSSLPFFLLGIPKPWLYMQ